MQFLDLKILDFIEEIAEKYNLDKETENDPLIQKNLSKAKNAGEKQFIKIIYSKNIFPSLILKNIVKDYLNKNLKPSQLTKELREKLSIDESIATQIFQDIMNNPLINGHLETSAEKNNHSIEGKTIKNGLSQELE